jgi:hypothetical protein
MDITVDLVESYLRLTGYLTLSEYEVQRRDEKGRYKAVTDIDIMALRLPGVTYVGDPHADCVLLQLDDPVLGLEPDMTDVIIGEVKQGPAQLNAGIKDHVALHSMLRRVEWLYATDLNDVIEGVQRDLTHRAPARSGGIVRTRLVAFGRSPVVSENVISLGHIIATVLAFFEAHEDAFRPVQFRQAAPAFLRLLLKAGFDVGRPESEPSPPR